MRNSKVSDGLSGLQDVDTPVTHIRSRQARKDDLHVVRDRSLYERRFKRAFDLVVGTFAAFAAAPLAACIAVLVRVGLGKPILYTQDRVGADGEVFTIYKFRTMRPDRRRQDADLPAETDRRTGHKSGEDPRHTGLGRRLRQLSLDELPQLINVFRGEMSLVGPRPEIPSVAEDGGYLDHVRHEVKPGMTGPYQTSDLRLNGDLRDGLHVDTDYVFNVSLKNDVKYILATTGVLLSRGTGS